MMMLLFADRVLWNVGTRVHRLALLWVVLFLATWLTNPYPPRGIARDERIAVAGARPPWTLELPRRALR